MSRKIVLGRAYVKRSGLTGKSRKMLAVRQLGQRVECIADDNGKTVIVHRTRLHSESNIMVGDSLQSFGACSAELLARLETILADRGTMD